MHAAQTRQNKKSPGLDHARRRHGWHHTKDALLPKLPAGLSKAPPTRGLRNASTNGIRDRKRPCFRYSLSQLVAHRAPCMRLDNQRQNSLFNPTCGPTETTRRFIRACAWRNRCRPWWGAANSSSPSEWARGTPRTSSNRGHDNGTCPPRGPAMHVNARAHNTTA